MNRIVALIVALIVLLLVGSSTLFTVDQRKFAVIVSGGQVAQVIDQPGLHVKAPPPFQSVVLLDRRVQTVDNPDGDRFTTADKKTLLADVIVKWRIVEPRLFMTAFGTDLSVGPERIAEKVRAALAAGIGQQPMSGLVDAQRNPTLDNARVSAAAVLAASGVELVDVRFERLDLLAEESDATYHRMETASHQLAQQIRGGGLAAAEQVHADADRQRDNIVSDAFRQAQTLRGEGDAQAASIYAEAYGRDPQFYSFYRSLEAYRASFANPRDVIVVDPSNAFFRFMRDPAGALAAPADAEPRGKQH
ncbi:protease modulator HflC [Pararobbsia alpina]|uniref:Protein HflC n=1 Tax=Pararobbsia alpina TaxID=621374 RepID=A0A6S7D8L1_9BURK|nr:protease modulator HflC [Pararobbsia alpina]CAB3798708.1 Modulator of FtsH protease HflC [Pararobbsia alpina]